MNHHFRLSSLFGLRLAEHGLSMSAVARQADLPAGFFQQEKIFATTTELFALYRAIGELSPDADIGLKFGAEPRMDRYNPAWVAAVCSRTFRDALERVARYKKLSCPQDIRVEAIGKEASVCSLYPDAEEIEPDVLVDMVMAWIALVGRRGTDGQIKPLRLELTRSSRHRALLEEHFGCRVKFKAGRNALFFHDADLDRPFITHNRELLEAIGAKLDSDMEDHLRNEDIRDQVTRALKRSLAGLRPSLRQVAKELGMSTRSLQRKLGEAGVTFQQVVESTRRELAYYYLRQSAVELNGVAFLLGYEKANSFFRAFQEWEGTSPGEWRTRNAELPDKTRSETRHAHES